jgi:hypothetical protein
MCQKSYFISNEEIFVDMSWLFTMYVLPHQRCMCQLIKIGTHQCFVVTKWNQGQN